MINFNYFLPIPKAVEHDDIAAHSPPDDPPVVRLRSYGLFVCPYSIFLVSCHRFTSGTFVNAIKIPPASLIKRIHSLSSLACVVLREINPSV